MAYMIVDSGQLDIDLTAVADSIRAKTGGTEPLGFPDGMAAEVDAVYEAGKKAERDAFWDTYQQNGGRENYSYAFAGHGWTDDVFWPKYDMAPTNASYLFRENQITSLKGRLAECGVMLDFSKSMALTYTFTLSQIKDVGVVDTRSCQNLSYILYSAQMVQSIDKLILRDDGTQQFAYGSFQYCNSLAQIRFEGVIGSGIEFHSSPLSKESLVSIVNALSDNTTGLTATFPLSAVNSAFATSEGAVDGSASEEWLALVETKPNWTISLV